MLRSVAFAVLLALAACVPPASVEREPDWPAPWAVASGTWVCPTTPLEPRFEPTLYVAVDGDDAADGRTPERAFATLGRAAEVARAGDVVWVRGGVYSADVAFRRSGRRGAPVVFESHPGECAVLDGTGLERMQRTRFESVRHVVFRNFVVRSSPSEGLFLGSSHDVVIANVRVHDAAASGILSLGGDRNLFSHVIVHDNVDPPGGGDADGISISSGDGNRIERCVAYRNSDDGVDTWLSTNTIVEHCVAFENGRLDGDGNGFKAGGRGAHVGTVVRRNVAFANRADGFDANSGRGVRFDHNTAFGNGRYGFVLADAIARNNLAVGNESGARPQGSAPREESGNSWNLGRPVDASVFASVDPAAADFLALRRDARVASAGVPLAAAALSPDLGAIPVGRDLGDLIGTPLAPFSAPASP